MNNASKIRILVAYATKYGATAEIAEKIGQVLDEAGVPVDVVPVKKVKALDSFSAIVLGSAVYIGRWRKEAVNFLKKNEKALTERDVWLFSSGPTGEGDPVGEELRQCDGAGPRARQAGARRRGADQAAPRVGASPRGPARGPR